MFHPVVWLGLLLAAPTTQPEPLRTIKVAPLEVRRTYFASIAQCMRREGFRWSPPAASGSFAHPITWTRLGPSQARTEGYGVAARSLQAIRAARSDPNSEYISGLSPADFAALQRAVDSCSQKAQKGVPAAAELVSAYRKEADHAKRLEVRLLADPDFVLSLPTWSNCMKGKGLKVRVPSRLIGSVNEWLQESERQASRNIQRGEVNLTAAYTKVLRAEIELAMDDMDCRQRNDAWLAAFSKVENSLRD